jgi:hypothetical protein
MMMARNGNGRRIRFMFQTQAGKEVNAIGDDGLDDSGAFCVECGLATLAGPSLYRKWNNAASRRA